MLNRWALRPSKYNIQVVFSLVCVDFNLTKQNFGSTLNIYVFIARAQLLTSKILFFFLLLLIFVFCFSLWEVSSRSLCYVRQPSTVETHAIIEIIVNKEMCQLRISIVYSYSILYSICHSVASTLCLIVLIILSIYCRFWQITFEPSSGNWRNNTTFNWCHLNTSQLNCRCKAFENVVIFVYGIRSKQFLISSFIYFIGCHASWWIRISDLHISSGFTMLRTSIFAQLFSPSFRSTSVFRAPWLCILHTHMSFATSTKSGSMATTTGFIRTDSCFC